MSGTTYSGRYNLALPPAGQYIVHAKATDGAGNTSTPVTVNFTIDTVPPPQPTITSVPANPVSSHDATFQFTDTEAGVSYLCKIDAGAYAACTSPKSYGSLADGSHTFSVEAVDAAGNASTPRSYTWVVDTTPPAAPHLDSFPPDPNNTATSTFTWHNATGDGVDHYLCSVENGAFQTTVPSVGGPPQPCSSPLTYNVRHDQQRPAPVRGRGRRRGRQRLAGHLLHLEGRQGIGAGHDQRQRNRPRLSGRRRAELRDDVQQPEQQSGHDHQPDHDARHRSGRLPGELVHDHAVERLGGAPDHGARQQFGRRSRTRSTRLVSPHRRSR